MVIRFSFLLIVVALCKPIQAQTAHCDSIRRVHSFSADSILERSLQDYYTKGHFDKLLRKHGVKKVSCAQCDAVWVELVFTVDHKGKIVPVKVNGSILCHRVISDSFIRNFYLSLKPLTVPLQFTGKCYVYRFGRALKC